jgi:hypothetical protein
MTDNDADKIENGARALYKFMPLWSSQGVPVPWDALPEVQRVIRRQMVQVVLEALFPS